MSKYPILVQFFSKKECEYLTERYFKEEDLEQAKEYFNSRKRLYYELSWRIINADTDEVLARYR